MHELPCYIEALNEVVYREAVTPHACGFRRCSRDEVARLGQNSMAQVLSYYPSSYVQTLPGRFSQSLQYHTLAATSPIARVYAEALVQRSCTDADFEGVQVVEGTLMYCLRLRGRSPNLTRLEMSLWWAARCRLPIALTAPNACSRLLALLSARWRRKVRHLCLLMRATPISESVDDAVRVDLCGETEGKDGVQGGERSRWQLERTSSMLSRRTVPSATSPARLSCSTFLNALPTFACLVRLVIAGEYPADPAGAAAATVGALRTVRTTSLTELELRHCERLQSLAPLAGAPCLEVLRVHWCGITDVAGLADCPVLSRVDVSNNAHLTDLSGLAGAPLLRELTARSCAVTNLDGLSRCHALKYLDLSGNVTLSALHGVCGAPRLQELNVACTAVAELGPLRSCASLITLDVQGCRGVRCISSLPHVDVFSDLRAI